MKRLGKKGFTLHETLLAMLVFSFAGLVAIGGMMLGIRNYREVSRKSEAQTMLWECMTELRAGFESADIEYVEDADHNPAFNCNRYGKTGKYICKSTGGSSGVLVFRPTRVSVGADGATFSDSDEQDIHCITTRDASNYDVTLDYTYEDGVFTATVAVVSGRQVVQSETLTVTALNRIIR